VQAVYPHHDRRVHALHCTAHRTAGAPRARPAGAGAFDELRTSPRTLATHARVNPPPHDNGRIRHSAAAATTRSTLREARCFPPNLLRARGGRRSCLTNDRADRPWSARVFSHRPARGPQLVVRRRLRLVSAAPHTKEGGARRHGRCVCRCGSEVTVVRTHQSARVRAARAARTYKIFETVAFCLSSRGRSSWCSA